MRIGVFPVPRWARMIVSGALAGVSLSGPSGVSRTHVLGAIDFPTDRLTTVFAGNRPPQAVLAVLGHEKELPDSRAIVAIAGVLQNLTENSGEAEGTRLYAAPLLILEHAPSLFFFRSGVCAELGASDTRLEGATGVPAPLAAVLGNIEVGLRTDDDRFTAALSVLAASGPQSASPASGAADTLFAGAGSYGLGTRFDGLTVGNLLSPGINLRVQPVPALEIEADYHHYLKPIAGRSSPGADPSGAMGVNMGGEARLTADWLPSQDLRLKGALGVRLLPPPGPRSEFTGKLTIHLLF